MQRGPVHPVHPRPSERPHCEQGLLKTFPAMWRTTRVCFLQEPPANYLPWSPMEAAKTFAFLRSWLRRNNKNPQKRRGFSAGARGCGELLLLSQYLTTRAPGATQSLSCHASLPCPRIARSCAGCVSPGLSVWWSRGGGFSPMERE